MSQKIIIDITPDDMKVEAVGVKGKKCMTLTEFLTKGLRVKSVAKKQELYDMKVPAEIKLS